MSQSQSSRSPDEPAPSMEVTHSLEGVPIGIGDPTIRAAIRALQQLQQQILFQKLTTLLRTSGGVGVVPPTTPTAGTASPILISGSPSNEPARPEKASQPQRDRVKVTNRLQNETRLVQNVAKMLAKNKEVSNLPSKTHEARRDVARLCIR